jgi:hypothetical protein
VGDRLDAYDPEQVSVTGARDARDPGTGAAGQLRGESPHTACSATDRHYIPGPDGDGPKGRE